LGSFRVKNPGVTPLVTPTGTAPKGSPCGGKMLCGVAKRENGKIGPSDPRGHAGGAHKILLKGKCGTGGGENKH